MSDSEHLQQQRCLDKQCGASKPLFSPQLMVRHNGSSNAHYVLVTVVLAIHILTLICSVKETVCEQIALSDRSVW
jgi:hypothetical protein